MPFGDVSGRVGHILGPSVEFSLNLLFGQPFWANCTSLYSVPAVLHTKHSKISCSTIHMLFVRCLCQRAYHFSRTEA